MKFKKIVVDFIIVIASIMPAFIFPSYIFPQDLPVPHFPRITAKGSQKDIKGNLAQMNFNNIELKDLVRFVSNIMGKNFIFDDKDLKGKVTILSPKDLSTDEVFRVFETVLNYYGFTVVQTPETIIVVKLSDAKGMAIESYKTERLDEVPPEDRLVTLIYSLEYLESYVMVGILRPLLSKQSYLASVAASNSLIMIDTASNLQRVRNIISELDVPSPKKLSSIKVYNVQYAESDELEKALNKILASDEKTKDAQKKVFITSYKSTNSLLINAPPSDMEEILRIIGEIDTLRPEVLVEAAIIEVSLSKGEELGIEWLTGVKVGSDTGAVAGGFVQSGGSISEIGTAVATGSKTVLNTLKTGLNIAVVGDMLTYKGEKYPSFGAFLRALATEDRVNILSTPQILTMNNEEAEIIVGENRPYVTSTRLDSAGNPITTFDYRDVGIKLKVKPYINKDGFVHLNIYQEITKVTESTVTTGSDTSVPAPTTLKRSTKTMVGIKDGQTVVISGLIRDDSTGTKKEIPILGSIPILGNLFGYKKKVYNKTNLLVFITPRIIYSSADIDKITKEKKQLQNEMLKGKSDNGTEK